MNIIVACSRNLGIGLKNNLPWRLKADMLYFKDKTIGSGQNAVIMGKNTWESLPKKPLQRRENLILSSSLKNVEGAHVFNNTNTLLEYVNKIKYDNIWVIGGEAVYDEFLNNNLVERIYLTKIHHNYECDTFLPKIPQNFYKTWESDIRKENNIEYSFCLLKNRDKKFNISNKKNMHKLNHNMGYQ